MALTKVRASQITGLTGQFAPVLYQVIPNSTLPNTTGDFVLEGSFFTPTMTVSVANQTVNGVTFVSDNKMIVNITLGAAEGYFSVTLNNGIPKTFQDVILVVLGEVFTPAESDWLLQTGEADLATPGDVKTKTPGVRGDVITNTTDFVIPIDIDFEVRFKFRLTPVDTSYQIYTGNSGLLLMKEEDNAQVCGLYYHDWRPNNGPNGQIQVIYVPDVFAARANTFADRDAIHSIKRLNNGPLKWYINNNLFFTSAVSANIPLKIRAICGDFDIAGIRLIHLAT